MAFDNKTFECIKTTIVISKIITGCCIKLAHRDYKLLHTIDQEGVVFVVGT